MPRNAAWTTTGRRPAPRWATILSLLTVSCALSGCGPTDSDASGSSDDSGHEASTSTATPADANNNASSDEQAAEHDGSDQPMANADALAEHAERLWNARVEEDWATVFEYQQLRNQSDISAEEFAVWSTRNEPFVVQSYDIQDVVVDDDMGWTETQYESVIRQFPDSPARTSMRIEKWQIVDGQWKLIPPKEMDLHPASPKKRDLEQEEALAERFRQSWDALESEDWAALYEMTDPRDRDGVSFDDFAEAKSLTDYIDYEIEWVEVIEDLGTVRVAIEHKLDDPNLQKLPTSVVVTNEKWIRVDGQWYLDLTLPEDSG